MVLLVSAVCGLVLLGDFYGDWRIGIAVERCPADDDAGVDDADGSINDLVCSGAEARRSLCLLVVDVSAHCQHGDGPANLDWRDSTFVANLAEPGTIGFCDDPSGLHGRSNLPNRDFVAR